MTKDEAVNHLSAGRRQASSRNGFHTLVVVSVAQKNNGLISDNGIQFLGLENVRSQFKAPDQIEFGST